MLSQWSKVPNVDSSVLSKEHWIRKHKSSQKAGFSQKLFSGNSTEKFLAQPWGHMGNHKRLRDNCRHPLEAIFLVMRKAVIYRKEQNNWKKLLYTKRVPWPVHLSKTERNLKCSQQLLREIQWASRSPVHKYCLCSRIKSFWRSPQRLGKPIFWQFLAINQWENFAHIRKLHQNSLLYTLFYLFFNSDDLHHFQTC